MRRSVKLLILLGCLVVVCLATWWSKVHFATKPNISPMDEGIEIFSIGDASSVSWTCNGNTITFEISQEEWIYTEDPGYIINHVYKSDLTDQLNSLRARKVIEDPDAPEEYGLDTPLCTVTAGDRVLHFGEEAPVGGLRYASVGDGKVYMVSTSALYPFTRTVEEMIQLNTTPDLSGTTQIIIQTQEKEIALHCNEDWAWEELDAEDSDTLSTCLKKLRYSTCLAVNPEDLSVYGLDTPTAIYTFIFGEDRFTLLFGESAEGTCVMEKDQNRVYLINQASAEFFVKLSEIL